MYRLPLAAGAASLSIALFSPTVNGTTPPPIEAFARMPHLQHVALSPDGSRLVGIMNLGDSSAVAVLDRSRGLTWKLVHRLEPSSLRLKWCAWANQTRILCGLEGIAVRDGHPYETTALIGLNADGSYVKRLRYGGGGQFQDRIIDWTPYEPDTVLVELDSDWNGFPSVYEMNVYTARTTERASEYRSIRAFSTDANGAIRLATGRESATTDARHYARLAAEREWRPLAKVDALGANDPLQPLSVFRATNTAYATGPYDGRAAVWELDLADQKHPQVAFSHPHVDVDTPIYTSDGRLLGIRYEVDRPFTYYTDERMPTLIDAVNQQHPTKFNYIVDATHDEKVYVIRSYSDVDAGTYFVLDAGANRLEELGRAYPELDQLWLGRMRSITYAASDGTEIPGYLTVPTGARAQNLPLVVLPHDGPESRDVWEFSFLRAFLVSRGYAVLQVNYRGSSGYGTDWRKAAYQDWGGVPYSDITDGTRWAVSEGIADPTRVAIAGFGFGGYIAQLSSIRNPELYRAAVSIGGFSDLQGLLDDARDAPVFRFSRNEIGTDKEKLWDGSPLRRVKDVGIPMLLIHGYGDSQFSFQQTEKMVDALARADKEHESWFGGTAGHGYPGQTVRSFLLEKMERFLLAYVGPPGPCAFSKDDPLAAATKCKAMAESGDADATFQFGIMLMTFAPQAGRARPWDLSRWKAVGDRGTATRWLDAAADKGSKSAIELKCRIGSDPLAPADRREEGRRWCDKLKAL